MSIQKKIKKIKNFRSLTVNLAIAFLILALVIIIVTSTTIIYFNFQNQKKSLALQMQLLAQEAANTVKGFTQEKLSILKAAVSIGNIANIPRENQQLALEKLLGLELSFRQLTLFNTQGQELIRTSRLSRLMSNQLSKQIADKNLYQMALEREYVSPVYMDDITSEPMILMAVPVTDIFGNFKGELIAEVNLKFMWNLVDKIKIGKKGLAYVVDLQGNLIAFGDIGRVLKRENLANLKEVNEFLLGNELVHKTEIEIARGIQNSYVITTHVHLGTPDWAVVVEMPVMEAYETVIHGIKLSVLVMLLSFILAIMLSIYLSKKITRPIIYLRDATRKIGKGNLDIKIEVKSKDEIGELAESFNQMAEDLNKTTTSIDNLHREITERQRMEGALKESQEQYRALVENTVLGITIMDTDYNIIHTNTTFADLFKKSASEFVGKKCFREYEKRQAVCPHCPGTKAMASGTTAEVETYAVLDDGTRIQVRNRAVPFFGPNGVIRGFIEIVENIDKAKKMEEALREAEEKYRLQFEGSLDAIFVSETESGIVVDCNPAAAELVGREKTEIIGQHQRILYPPEITEDKFTKTYMDHLSGKKGEILETEIITKNGERRYVAIKASLIEFRGKKLMQGIFRDITEQKKAANQLQEAYTQLKQAQEQLIQAEKLNAVGQLASGVAHEIRNPLAIILQGVEYMGKISETQNDDDTRDIIDIIKHNIERADKIIHSLIDFSRATELNLELRNINSIIEDSLILVEHKTKLEDFKIITEFKDNPLNVLIDLTKIEQVLVNLFLNAMDAMSRGGTIFIRTYLIQFNQSIKEPGERGEFLFKPGDKAAVIEVEDNGRGISKKYLQNIFDPFFTTKGPRGGTGLGLSVTKNIIDMHKGLIEVETEEGKGTKFRITLKIAENNL